MDLRVHAFLPASYANGPGRRAVVWVQGCTLGCTGCFNPESHPGGGEPVPVDDLCARILALGVEGVTLTGGEPLQQPDAVAALLARFRTESDLSVVLFTGYTWREARRRAPEVLVHVDVLLAGRYDPRRPKTAHFLTTRYHQGHLDAVPPAEVLIAADGTVTLTGTSPLDLDVEGAHLDDRGLAHLDVEAAP